MQCASFMRDSPDSIGSLFRVFMTKQKYAAEIRIRLTELHIFLPVALSVSQIRLTELERQRPACQIRRREHGQGLHKVRPLGVAMSSFDLVQRPVSCEGVVPAVV